MNHFYKKSQSSSTSWENVSRWYDGVTGDKGHFFQEKLIIPESLKLLQLNQDFKIIDLACGQGVLSRYIPRSTEYVGVDISPGLISYAKSRGRNGQDNSRFLLGDITNALNLPENYFTHASIILALQNIENLEGVFANAQKHLTSGGVFLIVLNHPCFRIPRQTSWEIDPRNKLQLRKVNRYLSSLKIPVNMTPGSIGGDKLTWTFHNPISVYSKALKKHGFKIELIDEWISPKQSTGKAARMENRAREEFPMFMAIVAVK